MYIWVARDKGSEWRALLEMSAAGPLPCRPLIEVVCEPFVGKNGLPGKNPWSIMRKLATNIDMLSDSGRVWVDFGHLSQCFSDPDIAEIIAMFRKSQGLFRSNVVPVVRCSSGIAVRSALTEWAHESKCGLCIRVDGVTHLQPKAAIADEIFRSSGLSTDRVDLFADAQDLPRAYSHRELAETLPLSQASRTWGLLAGTFPSSITHLSPDEYEHHLPREEWAAYIEETSRSAGFRRPEYGDYATQPAAYSPSPGFRASPTVRYTVENGFVVIRGRASGKSPASQYIGHSRFLLAQDYFASSTDSAGDAYVRRIATGNHGTGNGTTWRIASLRRHVALVAAQLPLVPGVAAPQVR